VPLDGGGFEVHARHPGCVLELALRTVGRGKLEKAFADAVKAVQTREAGAPTAGIGAS
jgi:hypothetical protein